MNILMNKNSLKISKTVRSRNPKEYRQYIDQNTNDKRTTLADIGGLVGHHCLCVFSIKIIIDKSVHRKLKIEQQERVWIQMFFDLRLLNTSLVSAFKSILYRIRSIAFVGLTNNNDNHTLNPCLSPKRRQLLRYKRDINKLAVNQMLCHWKYTSWQWTKC